MTSYKCVTKFEQVSEDSFGREVKTVVEFNSLDMSYNEMCEQFANFLRGIGYSYIETVVAYKAGEDDNS